MPDLEPRIAAWRARATAALPHQPETVRELEEHLRDHIAALQRTGMSADEAFAAGVNRLGDPMTIARQFEYGPARILSVSGAACAVVALLVAILLTLFTVLGWRYHSGHLGLLLVTHVFVVTAGYLGVFASGLVGACALITSSRRQLSERERSVLRRHLFRLTLGSVVLVPVGVVLGMFWAAENLGGFWSWHPREIGALLIAVFSGVFLVLQLRTSCGDRLRWSLAVVGNAVVAAGWFGASALTTGNGLWACLLFAGSQIALALLVRTTPAQQAETP